MGILTILIFILLLAIAITIPFLGIPFLILVIIGGVVYYVLRGGASLTFKGIKSITGRSPPKVPGEATSRYCPKCSTQLLRITDEPGFWCTNCKAWYE